MSEKGYVQLYTKGICVPFVGRSCDLNFTLYFYGLEGVREPRNPDPSFVAVVTIHPATGRRRVLLATCLSLFPPYTARTLHIFVFAIFAITLNHQCSRGFQCGGGVLDEFPGTR